VGKGSPENIRVQSIIVKEFTALRATACFPKTLNGQWWVKKAFYDAADDLPHEESGFAFDRREQLVWYDREAGHDCPHLQTALVRGRPVLQARSLVCGKNTWSRVGIAAPALGHI